MQITMTHFMVTCVSADAKTVEEPCPDVEAAAERRATSNPSVGTSIVISLFECDCMRYSVKRDSTLICLWCPLVTCRL